MELLDLLKQFKNIEPDPGFTKKSRSLVLREHGAIPVLFSAVKNILETGTSLALAGLMIFVMLGGLASVRVFQPLEATALDPASIKAEAEAIDIKIKLTGLDYKESAKTGLGRESTVSSASGANSKEKTGSAPEASNTSVSVDEALKLLSE